MNKNFLLVSLFLLIFTGSSWADGVVFDGDTISKLILCHEGRLEFDSPRIRVMDSERPIDLSLEGIPISATYELGLKLKKTSRKGLEAQLALLNAKRVTLCITYSQPDSLDGGTVNQITNLSLRAD